MTSLFDSLSEADTYRPLADRMRPSSLDDFFGQEHILAHGKPLRDSLERRKLHSIIFWGPPGVGKTTLARLVASMSNAHFETLSASFSGVKDIRETIARGKSKQLTTGCKSLLFVDEVHRFNKYQQDAFLPYIEDGTVIFIGATTENPSFELNSALLSRVRIYALKPLNDNALRHLLNRALSDNKIGLGLHNISLEKEAEEALICYADGDARRLLNTLELAADIGKQGIIDLKDLQSVLTDAKRRFDKRGDVFYDQISAFHKSVRGSNPDAALYWAARLVDGGADPLYIIRRLVVIASEDIGNADPRALGITINAWQAFERLGQPEGLLALAHATVYCASAAKSNATYKAWKAALADVKDSTSHEVPAHLRNAPTSLAANLGHGAEYRYAHDEPNAYAAGENYFPDTMVGRTYYYPKERGLEIKIKDKLDILKQRDKDSLHKRRG